eukprot:SAG11_NODE_4189_length_2022_cov_1.900156_1_plen_454_part_00
MSGQADEVTSILERAKLASRNRRRLTTSRDGSGEKKSEQNGETTTASTIESLKRLRSRPAARISSLPVSQRLSRTPSPAARAVPAEQHNREPTARNPKSQAEPINLAKDDDETDDDYDLDKGVHASAANRDSQKRNLLVEETQTPGDSSQAAGPAATSPTLSDHDAAPDGNPVDENKSQGDENESQASEASSQAVEVDEASANRPQDSAEFDSERTDAHEDSELALDAEAKEEGEFHLSQAESQEVISISKLLLDLDDLTASSGGPANSGTASGGATPAENVRKDLKERLSYLTRKGKDNAANKQRKILVREMVKLPPTITRIVKKAMQDAKSNLDKRGKKMVLRKTLTREKIELEAHAANPRSKRPAITKGFQVELPSIRCPDDTMRVQIATDHLNVANQLQLLMLTDGIKAVDATIEHYNKNVTLARDMMVRSIKRLTEHAGEPAIAEQHT